MSIKLLKNLIGCVLIVRQSSRTGIVRSGCLTPAALPIMVFEQFKFCPAIFPVKRILCYGFVLPLLFGCGYQSSLEKAPPGYLIKENVDGKEVSKSVHLSRLSIPVFDNRTFEPLIENTLTRRFRQQVLMDGHMKLVAIKENSDMILEGELISFGQSPLSFDSNNSALEYRISLVLKISLKDSKSNKILWQKSGITSASDYYVNVDASLNRAALDRAIDEASKVLAEDVISEILDLYR